MKKVRFIFLALLFFLASPEGAMASDGTWQGKQYLKEDGSQAANEWVLISLSILVLYKQMLTMLKMNG